MGWPGGGAPECRARGVWRGRIQGRGGPRGRAPQGSFVGRSPPGRAGPTLLRSGRGPSPAPGPPRPHPLAGPGVPRLFSPPKKLSRTSPLLRRSNQPPRARPCRSPRPRHANTASASCRIGCSVSLGRDHADEGWRAGRRLAGATGAAWEVDREGCGRVRQVRLRSAALGTNQGALRPCRAEPLKGPVGAARTPPLRVKARPPAPAGSRDRQGQIGRLPSCHGDGGRLLGKGVKVLPRSVFLSRPRTGWDLS